MKLTHIAASNLKGQTFRLPLNPLTFLVGANFVGKTARMDAIRLLLLGYLPELGKTSHATFGLSSGRTMEVSGTLEDGTYLRRSWTADGNRIRTEWELPVGFDDNAGQLALMLDANTYFSLSDRKRVEYVFNSVTLGSEWTVPGIAKRLTDKGWGSVIVALQLERGLPTPQEFVDLNIAAISDKAKGAKEHAARMEKTVQGLASLRAQDVKPAVPLAFLETQKRDLVAAIAALNEQKGGSAVAHQQLLKDRERRNAINAKLGRENALREKRAELEATRDKAKAATETNVILSEDEFLKLRDSRGTLRYAIGTCNTEIVRQRDALMKARSELANLGTLDKCPYCGSCGGGWKVLRKVELEHAVEMAEAAKAKAERKLEHNEQEAVRVQLEIGAQEEGRVRLKLDSSSHAKAVSNLAIVEQHLEQLDGLRAELDTLTPEDPAFDAGMQTLTVELNVKNDQLATLEREIKVLSARQNDLKRLAEAEEARDKGWEEQDIAENAVKELRVIQAEMVEAAFRPLMNTANSFFASVLKTPLAYNPDGGEIGTWRGGVWVSHATFSGVEKLLCYAAIQAALCTAAPVRIMLLDEMRRATPEVLEEVVNAVANAVSAGSIDQFVGIIPGMRDDETLPGGCEIVTVS